MKTSGPRLENSLVGCRNSCRKRFSSKLGQVRIQPGPDRQTAKQPPHLANIFYMRNICKVEEEGISRSRLYLQQSCSSQRKGSRLPFISGVSDLQTILLTLEHALSFLESIPSLSLSTHQPAHVYPPSPTAPFFTTDWTVLPHF